MHPFLSAAIAGPWKRRRHQLHAAAVLGTGLVLAAIAIPAQAQVESFILKPGSNVGPASKVKATNCVTAADGSVTCDTKIENNPADTPAKPHYSPFKN